MRRPEPAGGPAGEGLGLQWPRTVTSPRNNTPKAQCNSAKTRTQWSIVAPCGLIGLQTGNLHGQPNSDKSLPVTAQYADTLRCSESVQTRADLGF